MCRALENCLAHYFQMYPTLKVEYILFIFLNQSNAGTHACPTVLTQVPANVSILVVWTTFGFS